MDSRAGRSRILGDPLRSGRRHRLGALWMKGCVPPSNAKGKCFTCRAFFLPFRAARFDMRTSQTLLLAPPSASLVFAALVLPPRLYSSSNQADYPVLGLRYMRGSFLMEQSSSAGRQ